MASPVTLSELATSIVKEKTRIERFPSSLIVFGGALSGPRATKPKSCRDQFIKHLRVHGKALNSDILVPENYDDWNDDAVYDDLLQFEEDLGYLTSAVLIFLEAPGAIAELGAFSQIKSLKERLIVVVRNDHYKNKSFIKLGPLKQLGNANSDCIRVLPFGKTGMVEADLRLVLNSANKAVSKPHSSQQFDPENRQHQLLLTLDLISLAEIATFEDLVSARESFGITKEVKKSLRQALFTLEKSELISFEHYDSKTYYLPKRGKVQSWLDYTSRDGQSFHRERWQAKFRGAISKDDVLRRVWKIHHGTELVA